MQIRANFSYNFTVSHIPTCTQELMNSRLWGHRNILQFFIMDRLARNLHHLNAHFLLDKSAKILTFWVDWDLFSREAKELTAPTIEGAASMLSPKKIASVVSVLEDPKEEWLTPILPVSWLQKSHLHFGKTELLLQIDKLSKGRKGHSMFSENKEAMLDKTKWSTFLTLHRKLPCLPESHKITNLFATMPLSSSSKELKINVLLISKRCLR